MIPQWLVSFGSLQIFFEHLLAAPNNALALQMYRKSVQTEKVQPLFVMKSNGVTSQITMLADVTGEQSLSEMEPIFPH